MDDSAVQTAICVIGHPIAGNPSQFCTLRALAAMGIDWQCLSFDVPPESLPTAIAGIDVLRFAGALIAAPHHTAAAALLGPAAAPPCPAPPCPTASCPAPAWPQWIDGMQRSGDGALVGCNFLGDAFGQLLEAHQQKTGQPLRHCVYLGDAASFESMVVPYWQHLPSSCFVLGPSGLQAWPQPSDPQPQGSPPADQAIVIPASTADAEPPADADGLVAAVPPEPAVAEPGEDQQPPQASDPLEQPLLLIRPQADSGTGKKSAAKAKANPLKESLIESILEQLHPDSLRVDLAPPGAPWPVFRGPSESRSATISPLDLEIGRVAAAIKRWTGRDADRDVLAEAIEEYLEI